MNKVIFMGRLTGNPVIRYPTDGEMSAVASFSLAVNRYQEGADFFNCVAFGRKAEFAEKYLRKGTKILLTGRIQNNNYTNRNGQKIYGMQIVVEELEFAENKAAAGGGTRPVSERVGAGNWTGNDGFMTIPEGMEEELPFS